MNRGEALGKNLAVAAVGTEELVVDIQVVALTDGGRFLPDGEMGRALVVVLDPLIGSHSLDFIEHGLELADEGHITVDGLQSLLTIFLLLLRKIPGIGVDRNIREGYLPRLSYLRRVHQY